MTQREKIRYSIIGTLRDFKKYNTCLSLLMNSDEEKFVDQLTDSIENSLKREDTDERR
jgi:hypothetical protein